MPACYPKDFPQIRPAGELHGTMDIKEHFTDVEAAVKQDFTLHYRVTSTAKFLKKLLPVEKTIVNKILQKMKEKHLYDPQSRRWALFPHSIDRENKYLETSLYLPFNIIAESIRVAAQEIKKADSSGSAMGPARWVDHHSKSPKSHDTQGSQLRPDALFVLEILARSKKTKVRIPLFSMCPSY